MPAESCPRCKGTGKIEIHPIVELRRRAKKDQSAVALALGVTQGAYCRMEKSGQIPRWQLESLASIFGVTTDQLLGREALPANKGLQPFKPYIRKAVEAAKAHRARQKKRSLSMRKGR